MPVSEKSIEERLATIEEHIKNIDATLLRQLTCRHVTADGECDFFEALHHKVAEHEKTINQWTGAMAAVALICSAIGSVIGYFLSRWMK